MIRISSFPSCYVFLPLTRYLGRWLFVASVLLVTGCEAPLPSSDLSHSMVVSTGVYEPVASPCNDPKAGGHAHQSVGAVSIVGHTRKRVDHEDCYTKFSSSPLELPVILTAIRGFAGNNTATARTFDVSKNGFGVWIEEERSADDEVWHTFERVSYFAMNEGLIRNIAGNVIGEAGMVDLAQPSNDYWHTLALGHEYRNPVAFAQLVTRNGPDPSHIRLFVDNGQVQLRIEEWDYLNGFHVIESINYFVLESGVHTLEDMRQIEVGTAAATRDWANVLFGSSFAQVPAIFSQSYSVRDSTPIVTRQRRSSSRGFEVLLQEEEASDDGYHGEDLGYLAVARHLPIEPPLQPVDFVVDDRDLEISGEDLQAVQHPAAVNGSMRMVGALGEEITAKWRLRVPVDGIYKVLVHLPRPDIDSPLAHRVDYTVETAEGAVDKYVDQEREAGGWVELGEFPFSAKLGPDRTTVSLQRPGDQDQKPAVVDALRLVLQRKYDVADSDFAFTIVASRGIWPVRSLALKAEIGFADALNEIVDDEGVAKNFSFQNRARWEGGCVCNPGKAFECRSVLRRKTGFGLVYPCR